MIKIKKEFTFFLIRTSKSRPLASELIQANRKLWLFVIFFIDLKTGQA